MDGNVSARRIVCVAVRDRATNSSNGLFVLQLIDLIAVYCAICADRVQSGLCLPSRVRVPLRFEV